jgi:hypothetical protein
VEEALSSPYFLEVRNESLEITAPRMLFPFEDLPTIGRSAELSRIRSLILEEIRIINLGLDENGHDDQNVQHAISGRNLYHVLIYL